MNLQFVYIYARIKLNLNVAETASRRLTCLTNFTNGFIETNSTLQFISADPSLKCVLIPIPLIIESL